MDNPKPRKRLSTPLLLFLILMIVTLLLCAAVLAVWLHGRSVMRSKIVTPPSIGQSGEVLDSHTILHDGKYYRYREGLINLLLLGVDSDTKPAEPLPYGNNNQADVILLASLDTQAQTMTLISVSRDTMCDIAVLDEDGQPQGAAHAQLALSYAYGDGLYESCELSREAISNLFSGLQIDGYAAFYMGGIGDLNDAVGGVTVTVADDYPFTHIPACGNMYAGRDVKLTGKQARFYIQCREMTTDGNENRMRRQKQYLLALISQAREIVAANPTKVLNLYNSLSPYLLTDLDVSEISYLATTAAQMQFSGDILRVTGESVLGDGDHMELTVDEDALYQLILDVFYEEFTPEAGASSSGSGS